MQDESCLYKEHTISANKADTSGVATYNYAFMRFKAINKLDDLLLVESGRAKVCV